MEELSLLVFVLYANKGVEETKRIEVRIT